MTLPPSLCLPTISPSSHSQKMILIMRGQSTSTLITITHVNKSMPVTYNCTMSHHSITQPIYSWNHYHLANTWISSILWGSIMFEGACHKTQSESQHLSHIPVPTTTSNHRSWNSHCDHITLIYPLKPVSEIGIPAQSQGEGMVCWVIFFLSCVHLLFLFLPIIST